MKKLIVLALTACTLFSFSVSASATTGFNVTGNTGFHGTGGNCWGGNTQASVITNYSTLGLGCWTCFSGDSIVVVSGEQCVTVQGTIVTGKALGTAVIYAYKNGTLYSKQYLTIVRY